MKFSAIERKVRQELIRIAKNKNVIYYSELNRVCRLKLDFSIPEDVKKISIMLDKISLFENKCNRPLLSSVVIAKEIKNTEARDLPGIGFFKMALKMKYINASDLETNILYKYHKERKEEVHKFWIKKENHKYESI